MFLRNKIIIVEGMDCVGKTEIARSIANQYEMYAIDTDWGNEGWEEYDDRDWQVFVGGINLQLCQFIKSMPGWVKARFHLSEYVFSKFYERDSYIGFETMDDLTTENVVLIHIDIDYKHYLELFKTNRPEETPLNYQRFAEQRVMFDTAFIKSRTRWKIQILNEKGLTLEQLQWKIFRELDKLK
jgi:hypothetical protein